MTAIRETFEESGLLIASPRSPGGRLPPDTVLDEARHTIHRQKLPFQTFLDQHGLKADTESLMPFTEWITPVGAPR
jgi:8-oxo-dGTP pyrophosphatase MutT (NUDIX family)